MIGGIRFKVCGLRTLVDAELADQIGADFLGFIFHPKSSRHLSLLQWKAMAPRLPERKRVAVSVVPTVDELEGWRDAGFDAFQVHFPFDASEEVVAGWSAAVGRERLWLAPRLPPGTPFPLTLLRHASTVLLDTYARDAYGGTGATGDWPAFRRLAKEQADHTWILAGGLSPANIGEALAASGARFVDVNSGVETAPGIKDPAKLRAFALALHRARQPGSDPAYPE